MGYQVGLDSCPRCGDQLSSPIRSHRWPNIYVQTCRNSRCLHTERTVVAVAPEPERPRPVSLPLPVVIEPRPDVASKSAIATFERAYQRGETRKVIAQTRRQVRRASAFDGRQKRAGGNA